MRDKIQLLLREPLVHFLAAGSLLFLILGGGGPDPDSRTIIVTEQKAKQLASNFTRIWQREPTLDETDALIRDYIREEIYYREAQRLGLDENDTVIRRRLRIKMEELAIAQAQSAEPTQAALEKLLDENSAKYAVGSKYSFRQIWLGENGQADQALAALKAGTDASTLGAQISLPASMDSAGKSEIDRLFGTGFTDEMAKLPDGEWAGPVRSGFGEHLVQIEKRMAGTKPKVADIRQQLVNDWRANNISKRKDAAYQALLDQYEIKIAAPR